MEIRLINIARGSLQELRADLPLHHSQREIESGKGYTDFELTLRPTADFFTPLLSRGSTIKVLVPQWVADEVARLHREAAGLYD